MHVVQTCRTGLYCLRANCERTLLDHMRVPACQVPGCRGDDVSTAGAGHAGGHEAKAVR